MAFRFHFLAQQTQAAPAPSGPFSFFFSLDSIFWLTVLLIFVITIVSALLRRLSRDKTLKLFHEYHVSFFSERRPPIWGDLLVYSQGVELLFDRAFTTRRHLTKSSALLYDDELTPMICLTRSVCGLNSQEVKSRTAQIHRTFNPNQFRRSRRWFANLLNTLRDAITKTVGLIIGRMTAGSAGIAGAALSTQAGDINNLTGTFVGLAANAYEPLLERYIGKPVILEILLPPALPPAPPPPPGSVPPTVEFPGYLVDYTQRFVAVFSIDHTPVEVIEITLEPGKTAVPDLPDLKITSSDQETIIRCNGRDAFVLRHLSQGKETTDLGIAIIPGCSVILAPLALPATLRVERTRQIDLIVPRTRGRIRFGSSPVRTIVPARTDWTGVAPVTDSRDPRRPASGDASGNGQPAPAHTPPPPPVGQPAPVPQPTVAPAQSAPATSRS